MGAALAGHGLFQRRRILIEPVMADTPALKAAMNHPGGMKIPPGLADMVMECARREPLLGGFKFGIDTECLRIEDHLQTGQEPAPPAAR